MTVQSINTLTPSLLHAGNSNGWRVVYTVTGQEGDIVQRFVDTAGNPGPETPVNTDPAGAQDQADIAMLADGRFAIVWTNNGQLQLQRYDAAGEFSPADDQNNPLNVDSPAGGLTAIAGSEADGGFYTAAWVDGNFTQIWGRLIDATSGFLINSVTRSSDDFLANHPGLQSTRTSPVVAIGGAGFIAIGWQDTSDSHPGVYVRRFPLPSAIVLQ